MMKELLIFLFLINSIAFTSGSLEAIRRVLQQAGYIIPELPRNNYDAQLLESEDTRGSAEQRNYPELEPEVVKKSDVSSRKAVVTLEQVEKKLHSYPNYVTEQPLHILVHHLNDLNSGKSSPDDPIPGPLIIFPSKGEDRHQQNSPKVSLVTLGDAKKNLESIGKKLAMSDDQLQVLIDKLNEENENS